MKDFSDISASAGPVEVRLAAAIAQRAALIGVIGLGYVGLPLALLAAAKGFRVLGFDINAPRVAEINSGLPPINHLPVERLKSALADGRFVATADFDRLAEPDILVICVPTPLGRHREPDLSFVEATARAIAPRLRAGQLVVLESTTWPGTTTEVVRPILARRGLMFGEEVFLAYSPEREDPANRDYETASIPKVVAGDGAAAHRLACAFYGALVARVVPVGSTATAEAVKLTENIFRAVNIALVNELKEIYGAMGIDVWDVIDAAKTKPFGYMPFYPGPGLGGHCVPIDPFYLTWKAREFGHTTRFIELAGEINRAMPALVVERLARALDRHAGRGLTDADILLLGIAYKKNVDDMRESPGLELMERLLARGARASFHDPHVSEIPPTREHGALAGRRSVALTGDRLAAADAVLIVTDHDAVDYGLVAARARLVVDTRNVLARAPAGTARVVKA
jgi:UDP-N-acetyl-D-glucosamine dehydrogenase